MGAYKEVLALTQQFSICGNPFRMDSWKGCHHNCIYCFSNHRKGQRYSGFYPADVGVLRRNLDRAFELDHKRIGLTVEMLRHRVPLHFGGMSDPGQKAAVDVSMQMLDMLHEYEYPVQICTKGVSLDPDRLHPDHVVFQVSLSTVDEKLAAMLEPGAPTPAERVEYIKRLGAAGFWVAARIQPLVDVEEAMRVIDEVGGFVDFVGMEHLGIPRDFKDQRDKLLCYLGRDLQEMRSHRVYWEFQPQERLDNIEQLLLHSPVPVGVGDNDLQWLSDTDNCCGLDLLGSAFDGWMRYNRMYIENTGDTEVWSPKSSVRDILNSKQRVDGLRTVKDYVDYWLER